MENNPNPYTVDECVGSVSSDTMKSDDLLNAFLPYLEDRGIDKTAHEAKLALRYLTLADASDNHHAITRSKFFASNTLNEDVFDAMQELAPEELYFGASIGDGADYGFWPVLDYKLAEMKCLLSK